MNSRRLKNKPSIYTSFRSSQREFLHSSLSLIFVSPISSTSLIPTLSSSRCATREQPINQGERVVRRYQNYSLTLFRYFLHWKILLSFHRVIFRNNKFHITIVSFSSIIKCLYIQYIYMYIKFYFSSHYSIVIKRLRDRDLINLVTRVVFPP